MSKKNKQTEATEVKDMRRQELIITGIFKSIKWLFTTGCICYCVNQLAGRETYADIKASLFQNLLGEESRVAPVISVVLNIILFLIIFFGTMYYRARVAKLVQEKRALELYLDIGKRSSNLNKAAKRKEMAI